MPRMTVRHVTTYRYANPVMLGEHRMMFRPRDSHDLRLIDTSLAISPRPAAIRWLHDVHSNSVGIVSFDEPASELRFRSVIELEHFETAAPSFPIEDYARTFPFSYATDDMPDLMRLIERGAPDPDHQVAAWARGFLQDQATVGTLDLLADMTLSVKRDFAYLAREEEGVQLPSETLSLRSGTCRDFAFLMMEGVRALGFAARFVSGYIYTPSGQGNIGGGATHAWAQVYLPGAGWVEFDPTNGIVGNRDLIRVAVVRAPHQAVPLSGSWTGLPGDYIGMSVEVTVEQLDG